jgi:hypothetical protein
LNGSASSAFQRFVAIDWSGAKGVRHKGIAVAVAEAGNAAPRLLRPGHVWSRTEVLGWLGTLAEGPPTLIGMDFSFAPPFVARGAYLPDEPLPADARGFWAYVDAVCDDDDLGAAAFLERRHRHHFYFGAADGRKADYMHLRVCETAFNVAGGGKPSSVFDAVGAAQVAKASFAGMRLLHRLAGVLPVWPFDPPRPGNSLVVEIYCRAFLRMAGGRGRKLRTLGALNDALAALGSRPTETRRALNDNETDVLAAAAGLRRIAGDARYWRPSGLSADVALSEGWTFGVL